MINLKDIGNISIIEMLDINNNETKNLLYDVENNCLYWDDTNKKLEIKASSNYIKRDSKINYEYQKNISALNPGTKKYPFRLIKIQIGLKCNFTCSYCSQQEERSNFNTEKIKISSIQDVKELLDILKSWLSNDEGIFFEIWGGEPFLYWDVYKHLCEELMSNFKNAIIRTTTNGSLINSEICNWLLQNNRIALLISYDGILTHRKIDIFDNHYIKKLFLNRIQTINPIVFNCVLTIDNLSVVKIRQLIAKKLNVQERNVILSTEGFVVPFHSNVGQNFELKDFRVLYNELINGKSLFLFSAKIEEFINNLFEARPNIYIEQKCGMDREDVICISLKSKNVISCQNLQDNGKHNLGSINNLSDIKVNTLTHWKSRKNCSSCPVLPFCKGACLYLENEEFDNACFSSFLYNLNFLCASLHLQTGLIPKSIQCNLGNFDLLPLTEITINGKL